MSLTQEQLVEKVLVTMCMFSRLIRTEMLKQNRIISLINIIICLNLPESRISTKVVLTSHLPIMLRSICPLHLLIIFFCAIKIVWSFFFLQDTVPCSQSKVQFDQTIHF